MLDFSRTTWQVFSIEIKKDVYTTITWGVEDDLSIRL